MYVFIFSVNSGSPAVQAVYEVKRLARIERLCRCLGQINTPSQQERGQLWHVLTCSHELIACRVHKASCFL